MKKIYNFVPHFRKWNDYIDLLHRVKYFKPLFLDIFMIMLTDNENPNSESQKIWILHKINKKRTF